MSDADEFRIRPATVEDVPLILRLIRELVEYEGLLPEVAATEVGLREALFGDRPRAEVLLGEAAGSPAGFAVFFHNFSTFLARPGLYVEDVYVRPRFRGRGLGRKFFVHLAGLARDRNCGRGRPNRGERVVAVVPSGRLWPLKPFVAGRMSDSLPAS